MSLRVCSTYGNIEHMIKPCEHCGKDIITYPSKLVQGKDKFCSRYCANFTDNRKVSVMCGICSAEFKTDQLRIQDGRGKYCSIHCYQKSRKGKDAWNKGIPAPWAIGNKFRLGKGNPNPHKMFADENHKWKGDDVGYYGLHNWIRRQLGKPNKCESCGSDSLRPRQYHWANKSGKYKRDLFDWIRLCVSCHKEYDR